MDVKFTESSLIISSCDKVTWYSKGGCPYHGYNLDWTSRLSVLKQLVQLGKTVSYYNIYILSSCKYEMV
jgi:hypothetical protein